MLTDSTNFERPETKIQNDCWERPDAKCAIEKELKTTKTVLKCRILKARKGNVNGQESKANIRTITKDIQNDTEVKKGTKKCGANLD